MILFDIHGHLIVCLVEKLKKYMAEGPKRKTQKAYGGPGNVGKRPLPLKNLSSERSIQKLIWCKTFLDETMKNHKILERNQVNMNSNCWEKSQVTLAEHNH